MIRWDFTAFPVQWSLNPDTSSAKISGDRDPADVIATSFQTWLTAPNVALSVARASDTSVNANRFDGVNLVCFVCQGDFNKDASTLAVTLIFTADAVNQDDRHGGRSHFVGQIVDADIFFNSQVQFSTNQSGPPANVTDLQTVATHEIGHFFGMDHSGVVRAIMFPFAPPVESGPERTEGDNRAVSVDVERGHQTRDDSREHQRRGDADDRAHVTTYVFRTRRRP